MSKKTLLKFVVAFGLLAMVLIFLGVNFVPRIFASSSSERNIVIAEKQSHPLHSYVTNEQLAQTIVMQFIGTERSLTASPIQFIGTERSLTASPLQFIGTERSLTPTMVDFTP